MSPTGRVMSDETECVNRILSYLNKIETRCTYGAVAEVLGIPPQSVGRRLGQNRPEASWVVHNKTREPSGYADTEKHPSLRRNQGIIRTGDELREGLSAHKQHSNTPWILEPVHKAIYLGDRRLVGPDTMNAPWSLESRRKIVQLACGFFDQENSRANHELIGKELPNTGDAHDVPTLSVRDFLKYLEVKMAYSKEPNAFRVARIIDQMASTGLLVDGGSRRSGAVSGMDNHYIYSVTEADTRRNQFRLVPVLGPEFLYHLCVPGLVHITGKNETEDEVAGTGIVVHSSYVLTCRHVVCDMEVNKQQKFQGQEVNAQSIHPHPKFDVAVIRVDGPPLSQLQGMFFQSPVVAQTVYTLGYPKMPNLKEATVTMQPGAVTAESVTSLSGDSLFLYSAISRPGNSGGPVMSGEGYIVGLSAVLTTGQYGQDEAFSPHYAGISAQVVVEAVKDLCVGFQLPFENYE